MGDAALLASVTELIGKLADLLFALINFYGLVVIAVVGWIVNSSKDGPGVSWFRIVLFLTGFLAFFVVAFGGLYLLYERLQDALQLWGDLATAAQTDAAAAPLHALAWMPDIRFLWGIWGFNAIILILSTVLLRRGGYGKRYGPLNGDVPRRASRIGFDD